MGKVGLHCDSPHRKSGFFTSSASKSENPCSAGSDPQVLSCPSCRSSKSWLNGYRYNLEKTVKIQRFICRDCGFRFSESGVSRQLLNTVTVQNSNYQICVSKAVRKEAKNLDSAAEIIVAGDAKLPPNAAGFIAQFLAYLEKEGFCGESRYPGLIKRLAKLGANLEDPEDVKAVIGRMKVKDGMKLQYVYGYAAFAEMLKLKWVPPKYRQEETIPFIPEESELDALITATKIKKDGCLPSSSKRNLRRPLRSSTYRMD